MTTQPLLEIKDLRVNYKVYGGVLQVLDGVNFVVHAGEKVGLVGETGCGKTSTMKTILRILPMPPAQVTGGEIYFKGKNILTMGQNELAHVRGSGISMIFQDPTAALNPVFTVGQQMEAVLKGALFDGQKLNRRSLKGEAATALKEVSLADPERLLKSYPVQLSGGMRQRVCIAMALSTKPELLIADEPGTSLDVTIQDQVLRLLHNLVREVTDRVYVMYAGNMVESARTKQLFDQPRHPYTQGLMESVPRLSGGGVADGIPGRIPDYLNPPAG